MAAKRAMNMITFETINEKWKSLYNSDYNVLSEETIPDQHEIDMRKLERKREVILWLLQETELLDRERKVLELRYGFRICKGQWIETERLTLEKLGQRLQVTREAVRQIQNRAINKLRRTYAARQQCSPEETSAKSRISGVSENGREERRSQNRQEIQSNFTRMVSQRKEGETA